MKILRRLLLSCTALVLSCMVLSPTTSTLAASNSCGSNATYTLSSTGELTISGSGEVTSAPWENDKQLITSVIINSGITSLPGDAFQNCHSLQKVTIPASLKKCGTNPFIDSGLSSITFGSGITTIPNQLFKYCKQLTTITIPNTVTTIGVEAFQGCSSLAIVNLSTKLNKIDAYAFQDCTALKKIKIPTSLKQTGTNPFIGSGLSSITFGSGITTIPNQLFKYCKQLTTITIPNTVTTIGVEAFQGCSNLTKVTLSTKLNKIDSYAFQDCTALKAITIPKSLKQSGSNPFIGSGLSSITFGSGITTIPNQLFKHCKQLKAITIPNTVTSIGVEAFQGCSKLATVKLSTKLNKIGSYAFQDCTALKKITIPASLKTSGTRPFTGAGLTSVSFGTNITKIPSSLFDSCKKLTSISLPDSITNIDFSSFANCTSLASVKLPKKVKTIGNYAFENCKKLKSIVIPYTCTRMGIDVLSGSGVKTIYGTYSSDSYRYAKSKGIRFVQYHFSGATYTVGKGKYKISSDTSKKRTVTFVKPAKSSYTSFTMPSSVKIGGCTYKVTSIGSSAFKSNKKLKKLTIKSKYITSVGKYAFTKMYSKAKIYVPKAKASAYKKLFTSKAGYKKTMKIYKK